MREGPRSKHYQLLSKTYLLSYTLKISKRKEVKKYHKINSYFQTIFVLSELDESKTNIDIYNITQILLYNSYYIVVVIIYYVIVHNVEI